MAFESSLVISSFEVNKRLSLALEAPPLSRTIAARILEKRNSLQMSQVFVSADKSFGVLLFKDSMERDRGTERDRISTSVVNVRTNQ